MGELGIGKTITSDDVHDLPPPRTLAHGRRNHNYAIVKFPCSFRSRELAPTTTPNDPFTSFHPPPPAPSHTLRSRALSGNVTCLEPPPASWSFSKPRRSLGGSLADCGNACQGEHGGGSVATASGRRNRGCASVAHKVELRDDGALPRRSVLDRAADTVARDLEFGP